MANPPPITPIEREHIVNKGHEASLKWAKSHLGLYLEPLTEKLFALAAQDDQDAHNYRQSHDKLKASSSQIEQAFISHLNLAFNHYQHQEPTCHDMGLSNENDPSDNQTLESITYKTSADCTQQLYTLQRRLAALSGGEFNEYNNPIAPGVFAEGIQACTKALALDEKSQQLVYKVFDHLFMRKVKGLYNLINQQFESQGILPNLLHRVEKLPTEQLPKEIQNQESDDSIDQQNALLTQIYQQPSFIQQANSRQTHPENSTLPALHVIGLLQQVQQYVGIQLSNLETPQHLIESNIGLIKEKTEQEVAKSKEFHGPTVIMIGKIFDYIDHVDQLPRAVKHLLFHLYPAYLKLALVDNELLNDPRHPARQLLNSVIVAGERWVEPDNKQHNEVFHKIKHIAERVLDEFHDNQRLFSELSIDFNHYLKQHSKQTQLAENRAIQTVQGESKLKETRLIVDMFLTKKQGGTPLSQSIKTSLIEPWASFLAFNLLRFGAGSTQWQNAATATDDLLWFIQVGKLGGTDEYHEKYTQLKKQLPDTLKTSFETVDYDRAQAKKMLASLKKAPNNNEGNEPTVHNINVNTINIHESPPQQALNDPLIQTLINTAINTWFLFNAHQEQTYQCRGKLSWSNSATLNFMFINRLGERQSVMAGLHLANAIRAGEIIILGPLENRPFIEKALDQISKQDQSNESLQQTH